MLELLIDPRVLTGAALGFVVGVLVFFVISLISASFPGSDKKRLKRKEALLKKLNGSGYTVYMPLVMESQLSLRDSLSHDERIILSLDHMLIFDNQGNPITSLVPLTTNSEQEAESRRAQFKVVSGGKQN